MTQIPLQSYKATLPDAVGLERQGDKGEETWFVTGKMGNGWKDAGRLRPSIHSEFANWGSTPEDVVRFTKRFGPLWECNSLDAPNKYDFSFGASEWVKDQKRFREWWKHQLGAKPPLTPAQLEMKAKVQEMRRVQRSAMGLPPIEDGGDQRSFLTDLKNILEYREPPSEYGWLIPRDPIPSLVYIRDNKGIKVEIVAPDLWQYMILRLLTEKLTMLRVCQNKTCANPYFVATRKDQKYCDSRCSQLVASRQWYEAHGREKRRERNSRTKKKGKH